VLSGRHLRTVINQLRRERKRPPPPGLSDQAAQARLAGIDWAQEQGKTLALDVNWAKGCMRSEGFYDAEPSLRAFLTLTDALALASVPHYPSALRLTRYESAYAPDSSQAILGAIQDRRLNVFRSLLQAMIVPQVRRERPDVIGISLISADQVIAGFTLASLIKEAGIPAHVVLGGKMITCWRDQLPGALKLWDLFDSAIVYEGEVSLLRLVEALERGQDLSVVPNLMYRDGHTVHVNEFKAPEAAPTLPNPDFEGLDLDLYLAPERVLPVSASRGCYWGRCAFCNVGYGESCTFSERRADQVAAEMMILSQAYDTRHFFFSDEALSPRMLKRLSARLSEARADLCWTCCARFEPALDAELLVQMRQAGCRMVLYGLESGSQRVLDRMNKGTRLETVQRILKDGAQAGIWNHIFFFFGFPGETEQDAQGTIRFFWSQRNVVHSVCTGTFLLERHARVAEDPPAYEIARLIPSGSGSGPERDLAYYYEYKVASGIDSRRAEQIEAQFLESLPDKSYPQYYFHDIYRFLYACQFQEGERLPTMLGP
jgi:anaerobic magnesium-protoporphyrin IX monomethyl ester cyclase